jgi:hypothetical protein
VRFLRIAVLAPPIAEVWALAWREKFLHDVEKLRTARESRLCKVRLGRVQVQVPAGVGSCAERARVGRFDDERSWLEARPLDP